MKSNIRIMPRLDMQQGPVVKGVHFADSQDAGDPVACAKAYCATGADELAMLDIIATVENRATLLEVVKRVAAVTTIPFTVGDHKYSLRTHMAPNMTPWQIAPLS